MYNLGRTALKIGLELLQCKVGSIILMPSFICDVVWHPLNELKLRVLTYDLDDKLKPNWEQIENLCKQNKIFGIIMVNYFGQPCDTFKFIKFCNENNIYLIEDNSHGHSGIYNNRLMGTFGDIGFSSPRKFLGSNYGGQLYTKKSFNSSELPCLDKIKVTNYLLKSYLRKSIYRNKKFIQYLKTIKMFFSEWDNPKYFQESEKEYLSLSEIENEQIKNIDWIKISRYRRDKWLKYELLLDEIGLKKIFPSVLDGTCPWAMPVFAHNQEERNFLIKKLLKKGCFVFPWPALSNKTILENGDPYKKWQRMICFSLD